MIILKVILLFFGIVVLLIATIFLNITKSEPDESFKIEISLEKPEYLEGEYVTLLINVKNIGTSLDSLDLLNEEFLSKYISIKNHRGERSNYKGVESYYSIIAYTEIGLNEELNFSIEVNDMWGFKRYDTYDERSKAFTSRYFPEGIYDVELIFKYDNGKKKINSNKISFEVKAPKGVEGQVFEELKNLYKLPYGGFYSDLQNEETILKWIDFTDTYKTSIYFENAFKESIYKRKFSAFRYDSTLLNDCIWIIERNSNTKLARTAVIIAADVLSKMSDKNEAILFLEKVKMDHPGTESSKWAEKLLELDQFKK